jgi:integrase
MARHQVKTMMVEQARHFLQAARGHRLEGLFTLTILTGMREGELIALHWSDINFELHYLQVRRTIVRLHGRGLVESEPKTSSNNRKIVLSELLLEVLRQQRVRQLELRLQAGKAWQEHDLVFGVATGGHLHPSTLLSSLRASCALSGFSA